MRDLANLGSQARQCSFRLLKSLADNPTLAMNSSASASVLKALNVSSLTLRGLVLVRYKMKWLAYTTMISPATSGNPSRPSNLVDLCGLLGIRNTL